ncbi:MAG: hypothetical protein IJV31_12405 [Clostridia bacterium]|nr:hypothetical protein [Clostridia bacterium]
MQNLTKERTEEFWEFVRNKNFYENAPLFPNCYEALEKLSKVYAIYIVTAYLWNDVIDVSGKNLNNKYYYLFVNKQLHK